jgi:hypothetical protein
MTRHALATGILSLIAAACGNSDRPVAQVDSNFTRPPPSGASSFRTDSTVYHMRRHGAGVRSIVNAVYHNRGPAPLHFRRCMPESSGPMYSARRTGPDSVRPFFTEMAWACVGGVPTGQLAPGDSVAISFIFGNGAQQPMQPPLQPEHLVGTFRLELHLCSVPSADSDRCEPAPAEQRQSNSFDVRYAPGAPELSGANPNAAALAARAIEVLELLKARDMARLASLVHPEEGLRFSPWAYVRAGSDVLFRRDQVAGLWTDTTRYIWGEHDGTGEPIALPFAEYYRRYVLDHDFTQAPRRAFSSAPIRPGNTPSNLARVYPGAEWVEFHFPGFDPKYGGMDWSSLWLVFRRHVNDWLLVGIVHGQWTI